MRLQELKKSILDMGFSDGIALVTERRKSRFVSKRQNRPAHVNKKIDARKSIVDLIKGMTPDELKQFLEDHA